MQMCQKSLEEIRVVKQKYLAFILLKAKKKKLLDLLYVLLI